MLVLGCGRGDEARELRGDGATHWLDAELKREPARLHLRIGFVWVLFGVLPITFEPTQGSSEILAM